MIFSAIYLIAALFERQVKFPYEIAFDANGIVTVKAIDENTNEEKSITLSGAKNLSSNDIKKMLLDAEDNKAKDERDRSIKNYTDFLIDCKIQITHLLSCDVLDYNQKNELKDLQESIDNIKKSPPEGMSEESILEIISEWEALIDKGLPQELVAFYPSQVHILGGKQDIEGFKKFVEKGEVKTKEENVSDNNVIDENYLLLTEQEQKEFNKLQQEGLISKGLFNQNKDIVYTTKNKNGLIERLKELSIDWIKIETLNNWIKVSIDTLTSQKPQISKKVNTESTQKELIDKIKSIADRLGIKIERLDVIYNKQQEINTLTKKLETASDQEKEQIQKQDI